MNDPTLKLQDIEFLIEIDKIDEAETYILKRADQLDGGFYDILLSFAKIMETEKRYLAASLIYRSLLISILERAYSKAYSHAVKYLRKLDKLSLSISDWNNLDNHEYFMDQLQKDHGRKKSFWSKYNK